MYLRIKGSPFTDNVFKEIEAITDQAIIKFRNVDYSKEDKLVIFPIDRYNILNTKKNFWGTILPYKHDRSRRIPSTVIIRNVVDCKIEINCDDPNISEITILFGLKVAGNEISICSAEEVRGLACYIVKLRVSEIDLEVKDNNVDI